jgi:hypothetical protein
MDAVLADTVDPVRDLRDDSARLCKKGHRLHASHSAVQEGR